MGIGDNIMASGMARGAEARGKKIAFGDGKTIKWDPNSEIVFRGNLNVAKPGEEKRQNLEWIEFYKGHRIYNRDNKVEKRWEWNYDFKSVPGELFLSDNEKKFGSRIGSGFVFIEPNVLRNKSVAENKQWSIEKFELVAQWLRAEGLEVIQPVYRGGRHRLKSARSVRTNDFRQAAALLERARLFIGAEGGLHHAAAALGVPGVVLFGGFVPPQVTGYDIHTNLTGGAEACGNYEPCNHCREALNKITADEVFVAAVSHVRVTA